MRLTENIQLRAWFAPYGLCLALIAGCADEEQIVSYQAPKAQAPARVQPAGTAESKQAVPGRMLGAIVPHGAAAWFFKLTGPAEAVEAQTETFESFIKSIHFLAADTPPQWKLPPDWQHEPGSGMRYATLRVPSADKPLELTVITLPRGKEAESDYVLSNVNRWRNQLKQPPLAASDLEKETRRVEAHGVTSILVDIRGMWSPEGGAMPPFAGGDIMPRGGPKGGNTTTEKPSGTRPLVAEPGEKPSAKPPTYTVPASWKEIAAGGMRKAAFKVTDGDKSAEITIIDLEPSAGELLPNVNRWRRQVNLQAISQVELDKQAKTLKAGSHRATYVELIAPDDAKPRQTILGAIMIVDDRPWFIKLLGDVELAEREKQNFESFVQSLQFPGTR